MASNYDTEGMALAAENLWREGLSNKAEARLCFKRCGELYVEMLTVEGPEVFWAFIRTRPRPERDVKTAMRLAGWTDPNPPQARPPLPTLVATFKRVFPALTDEERQKFYALVAESSDEHA